MDNKHKQKLLKELRCLQKRVDALKNFYVGCGFHYSLVNDSKKLMELLEDYDTGNILHDITFDVIKDHLTKSLVSAERSANE